MNTNVTGMSQLSYEEVTSAASSLRTYSTEMQGILDKVKTTFNKVGDGSSSVWSGTAATATKEEFDKLSAKFADFYNAVSDCAKYLDSVVATYQAVDKQVMQSSQMN